MLGFSKALCWTRKTLDGLASLAILRHAYPKVQITPIFTSIRTFRRDFATWIQDNRLTDYEKIFVLDVNITECCRDIMDRENVVIIDHHAGEAEKFERAKVIAKVYTSNSMLMCRIFAKLGIEFTPEMLRLAELIDDYHSYKLAHKESLDLSMLMGNVPHRDRYFEEHFGSGFSGFDERQQDIIKMSRGAYAKLLEGLEVYRGELSMGGKPRVVVATMSTDFVSEVAFDILEKYGAEISFVIFGDRVSLRKRVGCDIDLGKLASKFGGGGYDQAAGFTVGPAFLSLTKRLAKI